MRVIFLAGACISIAGIVLRFYARTLATTQMTTNTWSIDEAAQGQLQQDARLIIAFGPCLMLLACHRWLWQPDSALEKQT